MPRVQPPVVVVPGIPATNLRDEYLVDPEAVWGILRKRWERVQLHPDDVRWEQREPARVRADAVFGFPYGDFIADLRARAGSHMAGTRCWPGSLQTMS